MQPKARRESIRLAQYVTYVVYSKSIGCLPVLEFERGYPTPTENEEEAIEEPESERDYFDGIACCWCSVCYRHCRCLGG